MKFTGKDSVFDKNGMLQGMQMDEFKTEAGFALATALLTTKAILKNVGARVVIGEEAYASVSRGKKVVLSFEEGKDQNYMIVTLENAE